MGVGQTPRDTLDTTGHNRLGFCYHAKPAFAVEFGCLEGVKNLQTKRI